MIRILYEPVEPAAVVYFTRFARKYRQFISLASTSRFNGDPQRTHNLREKGQRVQRVCRYVLPATKWTVRVPRVLRPFSRQVPCPMQSGGKRASRASVASIAAGSLTLHDANSNRTFLIDTGAEVSVVPATEQERQKGTVGKGTGCG